MIKSDWEVVKAFAERVGGDAPPVRRVPVEDARSLPFTKSVIRNAFRREIRRLDGACEENPDNQWLIKQAGLHRSLFLTIADYQEIDAEDESAVQDAFVGRLDENKTAALSKKYLDRAHEERLNPRNSWDSTGA